jgi:hypothetical protein
MAAVLSKPTQPHRCRGCGSDPGSKEYPGLDGPGRGNPAAPRGRRIFRKALTMVTHITELGNIREECRALVALAQALLDRADQLSRAARARQRSTASLAKMPNKALVEAVIRDRGSRSASTVATKLAKRLAAENAVRRQARRLSTSV